MKIDTHQHYWHYHAPDFPWISDGMTVLQRDCLPADCAPALRAAGVDAVLAVQARGSLVETDFLLTIAAAYPQVIGVLGWADLTLPNIQQQLETWSQQSALKGLRHILQDEADVAAWLAQPNVNHNLAWLQQHQLVYDVLVFEHQLSAVTAWCAQHDDHWLVLDHVGKPALRDALDGRAHAERWRAGLRELAAMPHVMCKLSGLVTETAWQQTQGLSLDSRHRIWACFDDALSAFGPLRLLYGSDWPVCQLAASYEVMHDLVQTWADQTLSTVQQQAFWSGNALRCYHLSPPPSLS